jgi:uncharacterized protein
VLGILSIMKMSEEPEALPELSITVPVTTAPVEDPMSLLIAGVNDFVEMHMTQLQFDASHDFKHIQRVLALAHQILVAEQKAKPSISFDTAVVTLASLLHDVEDHKYISHVAKEESQTCTVKAVLIDLGASITTANKVEEIISAVSYSKEVHDPAYVAGMLQKHPELAIVQDADRLDAIGAVGIGRTFTYNGAKVKTSAGMDEAIKHFDDKLLNLEAMMKTEQGRKIARTRTDRLRNFKEWWREETMTSLPESRTNIH